MPCTSSTVSAFGAFYILDHTPVGYWDDCVDIGAFYILDHTPAVYWDDWGDPGAS